MGLERQHLADSWTMFDTAGKAPIIVEGSEDFQ